VTLGYTKVNNYIPLYLRSLYAQHNESRRISKFGHRETKKMKIRIALTLILLATALPSLAEEAADKSIWARDKLLDDVGGVRSGLGAHGISFDLRLSQYYQGVTSGGVDKNAEYGGTMDYRATADLHKLLGTWEGLSVEMHARTRFGNDILADAGGLTIPNAGLLMPLPGNYGGTDVTGLLINQTFAVGEDHLGLFSIGKLDVIDAVGLFFPTVNAGQEGFWNVNALVSALPWFGAVDGLSLYGGWLATINKEYQIGQTGLLVTGTKNVTTTWRSIHDSFDEGVWIAAFHRFLWKMDDKPGYLMIFGGFSTRDQPSNDPNDFVIKPGVIASNATTTLIGPTIVDTDEEKPWDIAVYVNQVFWQAAGDPTRKASVLIGGTAGPDNPQFAQYNIFTSVEAWGPMASRPHDRMGVSFWYNWLSDEFEDLVSPVADLQNLYGFELYYNFAITPAIHVTSDIQFIENERKRDDLAVVPGVRLVIDF
jgi:porin